MDEFVFLFGIGVSALCLVFLGVTLREMPRSKNQPHVLMDRFFPKNESEPTALPATAPVRKLSRSRAG